MESVNTVRTSANARINRLPITSYHRRIAWLLGFVFFFDHADINTLSYAAPAIMKQWHVSISTIAFLVSATFMGMFVGATFGGWLSDKIGRKKALIATTLWYAGFSLLNGLALEPVGLFVTRLLTGVGISAMTVVGIAYISEIYPARVRGSFQGWIMVIGLAGVPATAYLARLFIPLAGWGWRLVFIWGSLGILFPLLSKRLEESPRWYENHGRFKEADEALERMEARISQDFGLLPPVSDFRQPVSSGRVGYSELLNASVRARTFLLVPVWIVATLGFFGFTSWVPTLLLAHGFSLINSLAWSSTMSLAILPGALIAALVADRMDRKWSIALAAFAIALCGLFYGLTFRVATIIVFGFLVEMLIHSFMPLMYAYTAESFPSEIRNSGTGLTYGAGRLANVFGPLFVAFLYKRHGYTSVFVYIASCWILVSILIAGLGTKSRELA
jgi:MFS transporter, putative metabolite:H+ symporter